jgi:hypothetical protein
VSPVAPVRVVPSTPRSHRNEGDEPVEVWAISRRLGRRDSTGLCKTPQTTLLRPAIREIRTPQMLMSPERTDEDWSGDFCTVALAGATTDREPAGATLGATRRQPRISSLLA